jgi:hypothetical protein
VRPVGVVGVNVVDEGAVQGAVLNRVNTMPGYRRSHRGSASDYTTLLFGARGEFSNSIQQMVFHALSVRTGLAQLHLSRKMV